MTTRARGSDVTTQLLRAAAEHAAKRGARLVEGYPYDTGVRRLADAFVWFRLTSTFERAGFQEVARRSKTRPIMRHSTKARRTRSSG